MIYYDEPKRQYTFREDTFVECTNVKGKIIEEDYWKTVVIKHFENKLVEPKELKSYLFKNLLYCSECTILIKKIELRDLNNNLRESLYKNIINQSDFSNSKLSYINQVTNKESFKNDIDNLGEQLRHLKDRIESINLFKFQMADFSKQEELDFIKNNWKFVHSLLSKIIVKAVLKNKNNDKYGVKIKYTSR